jgi:hypothetical protein
MHIFDVEIDGYARDGFEPIENAFARILAYSAGKGASLAIYRGGQLVVDLVGAIISATRYRYSSQSLSSSVESQPHMRNRAG